MKRISAILVIGLAILLATATVVTKTHSCASTPKASRTWPLDECLQVVADDVWAMFWQIKDCPALLEEIHKNPLLEEYYKEADNYDCFVCATMLAYHLSKKSPIWDDTVGEMSEADFIKEDYEVVMESQHDMFHK